MLNKNWDILSDNGVNRKVETCLDYLEYKVFFAMQLSLLDKRQGAYYFGDTFLCIEFKKVLMDSTV